MTVKRLEIAGKPALQQEMNYDLAKHGGAATPTRRPGTDDGHRRQDAGTITWLPTNTRS